jgi:hypothetical protein
MYDSFHHLLDPAEFVRRMRPVVPKFVLIEPAGDWLGGWQKTLEFDWIPFDIDAMRARLEWQLNLPTLPAVGGATTKEQGEPVEHRYTLADLERFFAGYGLSVRGTIAGIDEYPPNPYATSALREDLGKVAADTLAAVEEVLVRHDLDLHAKHWVVFAERGAPHRLRSPRAINPQTSEPPDRLQGAYDVEYGNYEGPTEVAASTIFPVALTVTNRSWRPWSSQGATSPVLASYHWLTADGAMVIEDGRRSPLPRPLLPGERLAMTMTIEAPRRHGSYTLAVDLVEEGVTWFSGAGASMLRAKVAVR